MNSEAVLDSFGSSNTILNTSAAESEAVLEVVNLDNLIEDEDPFLDGLHRYSA